MNPAATAVIKPVYLDIMPCIMVKFGGIKNRSSVNRATFLDANITIQQDYAQDLPTCPVTNYRALRSQWSNPWCILAKVRVFGSHPFDSADHHFSI